MEAEELVNKYRMVLMDEDTDCGNEILCTIIAKKCALIAVGFAFKEMFKERQKLGDKKFIKYWKEVKQEIENSK